MPGKPVSQDSVKSHSGVSLKTSSPEIRIGLEAAKPYKAPSKKDKAASDLKKVKNDEKKITMPGKPARIPARRPVKK